VAKNNIINQTKFNMMETLHKELSQQIIACFYTVYNKMGYGFAEKVYENALKIELKKQGFTVEQQSKIDVFYEGEMVGDYRADLIVNRKIILELKAHDGIIPDFEVQLINYLKATEVEVGYIINFGPKPQFLRRIFTNDKKPLLVK
jgi:GxxExxY protein